MPSTVWLLGAISLLNDAASELVYPLIPLYLATVLGSGPRALGFIEGAAEATAALLKLVSGVWYDRLGRAKGFVVVGYGLAAIARPAIAFVTAWPGLLLLRLMDRLGKGLRSSPRDALLAQSVPANRRGLAFGLHRAFDNAGAVIGPLLAAGLLALQLPVRDILLWAAVPGALCVALALAIREPAAIERPGVKLPEWRWSSLPPAYRRVLLVLAVFTLGQASNAFVLLRANELGMPAAQVALLWAVVAATSTLLAVPLSAWSDRIGRLPLLIAGWFLHALLFVSLALVDSPGPVVVHRGAAGALHGSDRGRRARADQRPRARDRAWQRLRLVLPDQGTAVVAGIGGVWLSSGSPPDAKTAFLAAAALVAMATVLLAAWALPAVRAHARVKR